MDKCPHIDSFSFLNPLITFELFSLNCLAPLLSYGNDIALQIHNWLYVAKHSKEMCRLNPSSLTSVILEMVNPMSYRLKVVWPCYRVCCRHSVSKPQLLFFLLLTLALGYEFYPIWIYTRCNEYCIWATWEWRAEEKKACRGLNLMQPCLSATCELHSNLVTSD